LSPYGMVVKKVTTSARPGLIQTLIKTHLHSGMHVFRKSPCRDGPLTDVRQKINVKNFQVLISRFRRGRGVHPFGTYPSNVDFS
jgi:hypothetical protein